MSICNPKIDITVHNNDTPQVRNNKALLAKELDWCQKNSDAIKKNAQKTYNAVISGKTRNSNLIKRSCNFKKLEEVLDKWIDKEIQKCNDVLKANPELMSEYKKAVKNHSQKHPELNPKAKHP